jgi:RimJ/RimL family protein N-acetyltransferase
MAKFPPRTQTLKNGNVLTIRMPKLVDASLLIDYINQVSSESDNLSFGKGEAPFTKAMEEQYIGSLKVDPNKIMALGVIEGNIIAVSDINSPPLPRLRHFGELGLSVMKKYWNIGVGTALLNYLIDWASTEGNLRKINLHVKETNTFAIHLYKKLGFVEEGRISRGMYINGEYFDLITMGLEL